MDDRNATQTVASNRSVLNDVWNVPNVLTIARLVLAIFCFVAFVFEWYLPALVLFVIAAGTDWVDGFYARRYGQITQLGRILDPFADKIIICGTFTFLGAVPPTVTGESASELAAWMAVIVVARELLVTALRSFFEEHGTDFSAKWSGKYKMVLQCAAVAASIGRLWYYGYKSGMWREVPPEWTTWSLRLLVWSAVIMTIYSGWVYVRRALELLRK
jgi:CDP-diacylglycerol--glycerol-3-phosphate 3-phosphatidyltransferase